MEFYKGCKSENNDDIKSAFFGILVNYTKFPLIDPVKRTFYTNDFKFLQRFEPCAGRFDAVFQFIGRIVKFHSLLLHCIMVRRHPSIYGSYFLADFSVSFSSHILDRHY